MGKYHIKFKVFLKLVITISKLIHTFDYSNEKIDLFPLLTKKIRIKSKCIGVYSSICRKL